MFSTTDYKVFSDCGVGCCLWAKSETKIYALTEDINFFCAHNKERLVTIDFGGRNISVAREDFLAGLHNVVEYTRILANVGVNKKTVSPQLLAPERIYRAPIEHGGAEDEYLEMDVMIGDGYTRWYVCGGYSKDDFEYANEYKDVMSVTHPSLIIALLKMVNRDED